MGLPWEAIMESLVAEGKLLLKEYGKIKARWKRQEKHGETQHHGVPWPWSQQKLIKSRYFDLHHLTTQLPKVPVSSLEYSKAIGQDKVLST